MVPLEYKGGAATGPTEVIVIGVLALAIILLGLLLMRSLKRIQVPYADGTPAHPEQPTGEAGDGSTSATRHAEAAGPEGDRRT